MRGQPRVLINTPHVELWPGGLLRGRGNHEARALARARFVLRRKHDGQMLAADLPEGLLPLAGPLARHPGIGEALERLAALRDGAGRLRGSGDASLPVSRLREQLQALGMDADRYAARTHLAMIAEPAELVFAGRDRYRRPLWLAGPAARAWTRLRRAAAVAGIALEAISGYRSHDYQLGIFRRKLDAGQALDTILEVNAAPGFSEHHSGLALDLSCPGEPPVEESFEHTAAFAWLCANGPALGFRMSYPRGNRHGIAYEPWHWRFDPRPAAPPAPKEASS